MCRGGRGVGGGGGPPTGLAIFKCKINFCSESLPIQGLMAQPVGPQKSYLLQLADISFCLCLQVQASGGAGSEDDDLFAPKQQQSQAAADANADALDAPDHSRIDIDDSLLDKWNEPGRAEQLRDRFVTGASVLLGRRLHTNSKALSAEEEGSLIGQGSNGPALS